MSWQFSAFVGIPKNANLRENTSQNFAAVSMFFQEQSKKKQKIYCTLYRVGGEITIHHIVYQWHSTINEV